MKTWQPYALVILGILLIFSGSLFAAIRYDSTEISLGATHTFVEGDPAYIKSIGIAVQPSFASKAHPNDLFFASLRYFYNFDRYSKLFDPTRTDFLHTLALSLGIEQKRGMTSIALGLGGELDLLHKAAGNTVQPSIFVHITPKLLLPIGKTNSFVIAPELVGRFVFGKNPAYEVEARVAIGFRFGSKPKTAVPPPPVVLVASTPLVPPLPTIQSAVAIREEVVSQPVVVEEQIRQPEKPTVDPEVRKEQIRRLWWLLGMP
ncbi:MAG: hypothetical protein GX261_01140 [Spirochaetales bacterium]|nr:hypothetical protein [Spirochaetales bacterium]